MDRLDQLDALDLVRARLAPAAGRRSGYVVSGEGGGRLRAALVVGSVAAAVTVCEIGASGAEVILSDSTCRTLKRAIELVGRSELRMQLSGRGLPLRVRAVPGARSRTPEGVRLGLRYKLTPDQHVALDRMLLDLFNDRAALRVRSDPDRRLPVVFRSPDAPEGLTGLLLDASLTGLGALVSAPAPLAPGTPIEVGVRFGDGDRVTRLRAQVVRWAAPHSAGAAPPGTWYVGVRFEDNEARVGAAGVGRYVVRRQLAIRQQWSAASAA